MTVRQKRPNWIDTNLAMKIISQRGISNTRTSFLTWTKKYRLGKKVGGRWYIDRGRLEEFLKGDKIGERKF